MYYIKDEFKQLVRSLGGKWNDKKLLLSSWKNYSKSIFFISDAIPITDKYILSEHLASNDTPYIIKNSVLLESLNYKLNRILNFEATNHNYFRQHITDIKESLIKEL